MSLKKEEEGVVAAYYYRTIFLIIYLNLMDDEPIIKPFALEEASEHEEDENNVINEQNDDINIDDENNQDNLTIPINQFTLNPEYDQIRNENIDQISDHEIDQHEESKEIDDKEEGDSKSEKSFNMGNKSVSKSVTNKSLTNKSVTNKTASSKSISSNNTSNLKHKDKFSDDNSGNDSEDLDVGHNLVKNIPQANVNNFPDILEYYDHLRTEFKKTGQLFKDSEFPEDPILFYKSPDEKPDFLKNYTVLFERPEDINDDQPYFFTDKGVNIDYDFKIQRGIVRDKFFLGSLLMLFRRREEYFSNLIIDYENAKENIKAGFCGFRFFINGEWTEITVDTSLPWHLNDDTSLSVAVIGNKTSFWLSLFEKAYSKAMRSYDALNDVSIKNTLVEFTGGISKKIQIKDKIDDAEKKRLFEDLKRMVNQKYLLGCMRFNEDEEDVCTINLA
jgi:hypothetical protein